MLGKSGGWIKVIEQLPNKTCSTRWHLDRGSVEQLRKAAQQGDLQAVATLANLFDEGNRVAQDFGEAAKWYAVLVDKGHRLAKWRLHAMYRDGEGVKEDPAAAAA